MEKRIELEKRGRPAEEVTDLILDNCRVTQVEGLTEEFKSLRVLSLINVGLTTLKGFPSLPKLEKLELSDNRISGGLNLLNGCPNLTYVSLSGNRIKDIETLEPLKELPKLRNLDLLNCEVTNLDSYREKVFEMLEGLVFLDGYDRDNQEDEDDEDIDGDDENSSNEGVEGEVGDLDDEDDDDDEEGEGDSELEDENEDDFEKDDDDEDDLEDSDDDLGEEEEEDESEGGDEEDQPSHQGVKRKHEDEGDEAGEDGDE